MDRIATRPGLGSHTWYFARHFLEMCAAMCIGGGILNGLLFLAGPALLGYPDLRQGAPELALLVLGVNYALPMAAWMRFRGMAWRPTLEMSGATIQAEHPNHRHTHDCHHRGWPLSARA